MEYVAKPKKQKEDKPGRRAEQILVEWTVALLVALFVALLLTHVIFINAVIPSESMEDTIETGDRVIGLRTAYWFSQPQRGDVVIFRFPDNEEELYVKRVIGLPGETVEIRDGQVYVDGMILPLAEDYVKGTPEGNFGPYHVPEDAYFMLGDNRGNSWDSRYWTNTYVSRDKILGSAWFRIFPGLKWIE